MILTKAGSLVALSIPDHRELAGGSAQLIRLATVSVDEFFAVLG